MKGKMKQRVIAMLCVLCMVCTSVYVGAPLHAQASDDVATTVDEVLAQGFTPWTLSDVGVDDQQVTESVCWDGSWQKNAAGATLDKTIFGAKFNLASDSTSFGNIYIGGDINDSSASKYRGFILRGFNADNPNLTFGFQGDDGIFYDKNGATNNQIAMFYKDDVGVELRGNEELEIAISVEYLEVKDGLVTMQVGVFFNGKLFQDSYYTVKDVPEKYLTRSFRWYAPSGTNYIRSTYLADITLETAPEREFAQWTFSDVGIKDYASFSTSLNWNEFNETAAGASLDNTIFCGKINFDSGVTSFGQLYLGGNYAADTSKYRGLRFDSFGTTDKIALGFCGTGGYFYNENGYTGTTLVTADSQMAVFDPAIAGTTLRDNPDLQVTISVEFISEVASDGTVDIQVGVFFDGKLYNNQYYTVKGIQAALLTQNARFYMGSAVSGVDNAIFSDRVADITLKNAPERNFKEWRYSDLGLADGVANWDNTTKISASLHQTLFRGKVKFNSGVTLIGGVGDTTTEDGSKWRGIRFDLTDTDKLNMSFVGTGGRFFDAEGDTGSTAMTSLVTFNPTTAGTDLIGNSDLDVAVSVEYLNPESDVTDIKIGVFFDGKLYNNTYYKVGDVPTILLHQNVVTQNVAAASITAISSERTEQITLDTAPENEFTYWSFRDIEWADRSFTGHWDWKLPSDTTTLDKTIFNGKIHFPVDSSGFGNLYIGGDASQTAETASPYRGFIIRGNSGAGNLNMVFSGVGDTWYDKNGAMSSKGPFLTFYPDIAGTTLRGNPELQVSLSVDILETDETTGLSSVQVGVFFDGKLYNNEYYVLKDIDARYLTRNVRWYGAPDSEEEDVAFATLAKATNVAAAENGATAYTSHLNAAAENTGYGAEALIDGIASQNAPYFRSASGADMQEEAISVVVEFADIYSVDHIRLYKYAKADGFPSDFTIEALTEDGWTTVKTVSDYVAEDGFNDFRFADTVCTAVRVKTTSNGTTADGYGVCFGEMQVLGVAALGDVELPYTQAEEAVVLVPGVRAEKVNNGVLVGEDGHRVLTDSASDTIRIQTFLETAIDVQSVQVHAKEAGKFANSIQIYAFTGSEWEEVYNNAAYTYGAAQTMHEFEFSSPVTCTNIMLLASGVSELYQSYGMQLAEVRAHGMRSDSEITVFGDTNGDGDITEAVELEEMRQVLIAEHTADVQNDWNMDDSYDVRDLVRMKQYLPLSEGVVRTYDLSCMTWNVLGFQSEDYQDQATRAPYIAEEILAQDVDLVGIQEAGGLTYDWAANFDNYLCTNGPYKSLKISQSSLYQSDCAYYVENGCMPAQSGLIIYYKADRFVLQDYGSFKYSVGQPTLTGNVERWFMYAELLDTKSGETVYMTNTHWSSNLNALEQEDFEAGAEYHAVQSQELMNHWKNQIGDSLMFATGDFNAYADTEAIAYLNSDIYKEANATLGYLSSLKEHIDHIFVNPQKMDVKNFEMKLPTFTLDGTTYNCSDHSLYTTEVTYRK